MPIRGRWFRAWRRASALRSVRGNARRVVLIDCGVKRAILQQLEALGAEVYVVPYDATEAELLAARPGRHRGVAGAGRSHRPYRKPSRLLRGLAGRKPLYGICLGHQLLALACGARTYKLPYGHRGGNQPVLDVAANEVLVTAHNHGYAVDARLAAERARGDDDQPQRRHERRFSPSLASDRGACSFTPKPRPVRSTLAGSSHDGSTSCRRADRRRRWRRIALPLRAAGLARLTVQSFVLAADTANPQVDVPFHLIVTLRVRERVNEVADLNLPILAELELLGDERETASTPRGTQYRETITVVAHRAGPISIAPATLQAIDARDGKAKQWFTNGLDAPGGGRRAAGARRRGARAAAALRSRCCGCCSRWRAWPWSPWSSS